MSFGYDVYEYARRGDLEGLREALATNKPDTYMAYDGSTALVMACRCGHNSIVKELLAQKASTEIRTDEGSTVMHHAVSGANMMLINQLIKAGVSVNEPNEDGVTPLILSAHYGQRATCMLLIDKQADVSTCAEGWGTALDNAHAPEVIELLEKYGAKRSEGGADQPEASGAERFHYGCFEEGAAHGAGPGSAEPKVDLPPDGDRATAEGTERLLSARLHPDAQPRTLGSSGLRVSPVGFGCHRLENDSSQRAALAFALSMGCNFVDLAPNYTDGTAERVAGEVVKELIAAQKVRRDELVIATKVGNVLGQQLQFAEGVPGMTSISDNLKHCISPEWIAGEITRSLERLQLTCLDFVLLHCPEFEARNPDVDLDEVYERLGAAFRQLEVEVTKGRIAFYGLSAAFMPLRPTEPEHLDLARVMAQLPEGGHHFRAIQFPVNYAEASVLWVSHGPRTPEGALVTPGCLPPSLTSIAAEHGLATLANRPLDGIWKEQHGILRFTSLDCDVRTFSELQLESCDQLEQKLTNLTKLDRQPFGTGSGAAGELASKSVKVLSAATGIDCVLLGMRRPEYVAGTLPLVFGTPRLESSIADAAIKNLHETIGMWFATSIYESDHGTSKTWRLPVNETQVGA